jgi:hypothetical protein
MIAAAHVEAFIVRLCPISDRSFSDVIDNLVGKCSARTK